MRVPEHFFIDLTFNDFIKLISVALNGLSCMGITNCCSTSSPCVEGDGDCDSVNIEIQSYCKRL